MVERDLPTGEFHLNEGTGGGPLVSQRSGSLVNRTQRDFAFQKSTNEENLPVAQVTEESDEEKPDAAEKTLPLE